ncbi:UNVERIFIED_ORG: hypothetical protein ABIC97_003640 [Peribacillus simplex]
MDGSKREIFINYKIILINKANILMRLFDESYKYQKNETKVEKNTIRYNLKYDQDAGVIFSVSKVN